MMLYEYLKQAGTLDSLKVHAAQRTDNTYLDYQELEEVSPTTDGPGSTYICGKRYQNQILNLAFLHGGSQLINDPVFLEMVKNIEIIPDQYAENINRNGNYILKQDGKYHKLPDNPDMCCLFAVRHEPSANPAFRPVSDIHKAS